MHVPLPRQPAVANRAAAAHAAAPLHLLGVAREELRAWLAAAGHDAYRADQILSWIYRRQTTNFDDMTDLSKGLRAWLTERAAVLRSTVLRESASADGTRKLLLGWPDGASVETVWIPAGDRNTVCVSSQVGCPVGCRFCASGLEGVERNLTAGEIVEQAVRIGRLVAAGSAGPPVPLAGGITPADRGIGRGAPSDPEVRRYAHRLSNIVLMGMGEPLANYREVVQAIRILNAPWGLGVGARKITLSTVGLPKQIRQLAREGLQINLALSLHAPDEQLRRELIPWARGIKLADLLEACGYYFQQTGREVTLEYVLLAGVNDLPRHAQALAHIAKRLRANVNLLRYNAVAGLPYARPTAQAAHRFQAALRRRGVNAHIRPSRGTDVQAACGQLRRQAVTSA